MSGSARSPAASPLPATLIVNPEAGQGRFVRRGRATWRLHRIVDVLGRRYDLQWELTRGPGEASNQVRAAVRDGTQVIFALGGDGTLRECAQGLLGTTVPLGLLAGGTTNVLAPSLGVPVNAIAAAEAYARPQPRREAKLPVRALDVGFCGERPFLMMMSRGLDGRALAAVPPARKRRFGRAAVVLGGLMEFARGPEPPFAVRWQTHSGESVDAEPSFFAACNIPHYAGRFRLAPDASPFDRHLDVVALGRHGRWATLRFAGGLARGLAHQVPGVVTARSRDLLLDGEGPALLQIDGDPVLLDLPVRVRVARRRLLLVRPLP